MAARRRQLSGAVTERQHELMRVLATVHGATTGQLARAVFGPQPSADRLARRHLARLRTAGLVRRFPDRSRDRKVGAAGHVHALTTAGLRRVGTGGTLGGRQRTGWRPTPAFLAHRLAISELYVRLIERQAAGGPALREFAAEPDCWRRYAGPAGRPVVVRPDALVRLGLGASENSWFVEVDLGTEGPAALAAKCQAYRRYEATGIEVRRCGVFPGVMFVAPDDRRAAAVRRVIARQPVSARSLFVVATGDQAPTALAEVEETA